MFDKIPSPSPQLVKKFYFLDYFLILLQSCKNNNDFPKVFQNFKYLKNKLRLGESKYRRLVIDNEDLSENQVRRYIYTFEQVIIEAVRYGLVKNTGTQLSLTKMGKECLHVGESNKGAFYQKMLFLMEEKYSAFFHLVKLCYDQNKVNNGLLIFPIYSPRKLGFEKKEMITNGDWINFSKKLRRRLEVDIEKYLGKRESLKDANDQLLSKLIEDNLLKSEKAKFIDQRKYNLILGRFRRYWLNYFLKHLYDYPFSFDTFNIWVERGKQLGIVHSTEFYPNFDGRLVFPTSIIVKKNRNDDFSEVFIYPNDEKLYIHKPSWEIINNQESFIDALVDSYFDIKRKRRTHFIRLSDLRERVCYKIRIPSFVFNEFLQRTYNNSLKGLTRVQISLEADRLPYETNAMYLKREPVLVNEVYKNIIAIDYKK